LTHPQKGIDMTVLKTKKGTRVSRIDINCIFLIKVQLQFKPTRQLHYEKKKASKKERARKRKRERLIVF
jgi:hypothetical protein